MLHSVYFWLKPGVTDADRRSFEAELASLIQLEYLASGFAGKPAPTETRPVTDHSFSYSLVLRFKSVEDHEFYQTRCPVHAAFVAGCRNLWEKVVVYDSDSLT